MKLSTESILRFVSRGGVRQCDRVRKRCARSNKSSLAAIVATNAQVYELDHIVPLERGAAPLDENHFQLQP